MLNELLGQSFDIFLSFGWIVILVLIIVILRQFWLTRIITNYIDSLDFITLELSIPKENIKSAKSMEQVFATVYGVFSFGLRWWEKFIEGKVESWLSFEMVGTSEGIRFYVRTPKEHRNLIETAFFSQYPNMEIEEVEDYTKSLPRNLPNKEYEIFATDIILGRNDGYPIRTYVEFEDDTEDEDKNVDPISIAAEAMSKLATHEFIWLQLLVRPVDNSWVDKSKELTEELAGRKKKEKKKKLLAGSSEFAQNLVNAALVHPEWSEGGGQDVSTFRMYTPGEQEAMKAIGRKASKRAFETIWRFVYIDKRDEFTGANIESVFGAIQQFATIDMNFLRPNIDTLTKKTTVSKIPISSHRNRLLEKRKSLMYQAYINREMPQPRYPAQFKLKHRVSIFNIEELASIYHPPTVVVKAPKLQPLVSKKGGPPVDLPIKE